jgi:serine/threonine-protein kinase
MAITTNEEFLDLLRGHRLVGTGELEQLQVLAVTNADPRNLARQAVEHNWLTPFQVNQVFLGRAAQLHVGQYVLLERLGEGAMGQVFKVRHRLLDRVAALKMIRHRYLSNPDAVRRFCKEIQAMARLSHPNIVYEFDAGIADDTYFIVMEYVEGVDLRSLVRREGPLGWARAADYVRQTAHGLQHAFERRMVHRDIKPSNLLLTTARSSDSAGPGNAPNASGDVIKIFDMGLSLLLTPPGEEDSASLTRANVFIGTPDYVAPEQAQSPHWADIRSDLYSLGCTLYFLLTGEPPFPGGTPLDKVIRHCQSEPLPLEQRRPEAPDSLIRIVRRLMAKTPEARHATPAALAAALTDVLQAKRFVPPDLDDVPMALPVEDASTARADSLKFDPPDGRIIRLHIA